MRRHTPARRRTESHQGDSSSVELSIAYQVLTREGEAHLDDVGVRHDVLDMGSWVVF